MTSVADGGKGGQGFEECAGDGKVDRVSAMSAELCEDAAVGVVKFAREKRNDTSS
jgi:hypothetical protein